eukprot:snap_masked-scaffold_2-processed-gene-13.29-mRNA-1 protein AED:1.00 eAED:1.00 QI:0/-1/0/0/-1/1/1/0/416
MKNPKAFLSALFLLQNCFSFEFDKLNLSLQQKLTRVESTSFSLYGLTFWRSSEENSKTNFELYMTNFHTQNDIVFIVFPNNEDTSAEAAQAFVDSAAFWNNVIGPTELQTVNSNGRNPAQFCSDIDTSKFPNLPAQFDVIMILSQMISIDGRGKMLGRAGPCAFDRDRFPRVGRMSFDTADTQRLLEDRKFDEVIRHEMGHVLGIGTLWDSSIVQNLCTRFNPCNNDPVYVGEHGREGFYELGGMGDLPLADEGTSASANVHFKESVFKTELMTPVLSNGINPLSMLSVKSLMDLGYRINVDSAESYQIPGVSLPVNPSSPASEPAPFPSLEPTESPSFPTSSDGENIPLGNDAQIPQGRKQVLQSVYPGAFAAGVAFSGAIFIITTVSSVLLIKHKRHKDRAKALMEHQVRTINI